METNNHGHLKDEVGHEDITEDLPLVLGGVLDSLLLDLVLLERRNLVGDQIWHTTTKIDDLV